MICHAILAACCRELRLPRARPGEPHLSQEERNAQTNCYLRSSFVLMVVSGSFAHDFWVEKAGTTLKVVYGHGAQRLPYDPSTIKEVRGFDASGERDSGRQWRREG